MLWRPGTNTPLSSVALLGIQIGRRPLVHRLSASFTSASPHTSTKPTSSRYGSHAEKISAAECARGAPEANQLTKRMLNETIGAHLFTELTAGAAASATARTTEAAAEGLAAFFEKREPKWK